MSDLERLMHFQICAVHLATGMVQEHRFDPIRRWRFDFAWPARMLALEVEGGTYSGGRHTTGAGFEKDAEKYAEAAISGWTVLRVTGKQVKSGMAIDWLERLMGVCPEAA